MQAREGEKRGRENTREGEKKKKKGGEKGEGEHESRPE